MPTAVLPNLQSGRLRRRITIQKYNGVLDADTEADTDASVNWVTFATVWASIVPTSGTAIGAPNADLQGVVEYLVSIRYYPGVDQGMQVVDQTTGLTLDVLAVIDINEVHRQMHLECVSRKFPPV